LLSIAIDIITSWPSWSNKDLNKDQSLTNLQFGLHPKGDEWKTTFCMQYDHFKYNVMPFGFTNTSTIFQQMMNDILCKYLNDFVVSFLDDILVHSKNEEKYHKHVCLVFKKIYNYIELYAKLEKCVFHDYQMEFFSYIICSKV